MDGWMKNCFPKTMWTTEAHHQDMVLGWENRNDCRTGLKYIYCRKSGMLREELPRMQHLSL